MLDVFLEEHYPRTIALKDGTEVTIRPVERKDFERLFQFFRHIPVSERLFLQQDVSNPHTVRGFVENIDYWEKLPLIAETHNRIVGYASLYQNHFGWMRSIGRMRIIILPEFRKQGLGRQLVGDIVKAAEYSGLDKIDLELVNEQDSKPFIRMGFFQAAVLKDHVKDFSGNIHDYIILVYDVVDKDEEIPGR